MAVWHDFEADLVGDRSDEPRLPARQVHVLHRSQPARLREPARSSAWRLLATPTDRGRRPRPRSVDAVRRWGRRLGLTVGLLVSVLVARLTGLATGSQLTLLPLLAGAAFGELAGWVLARLFTEWADTTSTMAVGGRR